MDAAIIGSGPNGLSAAITLAMAGRSVTVFEANAAPGGGLRSESPMDPACVHDHCATILALTLASPFLRTLPLEAHGLEFAHPEAPLAHPFDDGTAVVLERSVDQTAAGLGARDGEAYRRLLKPWLAEWEQLMEALLAPPGRRHPLLSLRFATLGVRSAIGLARRFEGERARALLAGAASHSMVPLGYTATAAYGLGLLLSAHAVGWPVARGGSQRAANALVGYLRSLGGEVVTGRPIMSLSEVAAPTVLCDVTPRQLVTLAGDRMPAAYRQRLGRYRYGPGVFKMDWVLNAPVPWKATGCRRAGTVHVGGTLEAIAANELDSWNGRVPQDPFVIVVQPSIFDHSRAPAGTHTLWAYCHVPHGSSVDMSDAIERQIERFAPGFRDCILMRRAMGPADLWRHNQNLIGGDIAGGASDLAQIVSRPISSLDPYATPMNGVYLCSSSTPPGIGVHGMCGHHAANAALRRSAR